MKIAVSNIAWLLEDDEEAARLLQQHGVGGVELAPSVVWRTPETVARDHAHDYRKFWERHGIQIVAMQALLFGRPELVIFTGERARRETLEYLKVVFRLAGWLGATKLVFGSPANRHAGALATEQSWTIATDFFRRAGSAAAAVGVTLCLEPNPPQYGCDFINSVAEARTLVNHVNSPGFGLHLDSGAMTLQGDPPEAIGGGSLPLHFHISEPSLAPLGSSGVDHARFARALRAADYQAWCSIEARRPSEGSALAAVTSNVLLAIERYRSA